MARTSIAWVSRGFFAAGVGLLAFAGWQYFFGERPDLEVERPARTFASLQAGKEHEVLFHVHNRSGQTRRVVGAGIV